MAKDNSDGAGGGAGIRASYLPQRHMREMQHVRRGRTQSGEPTSEGGSSALLVIDMQNYTCHKDGALFTNQSGRNFEYFWERLETVTLPKLQMLLGKCRSEGVECIYTVIECLTRDCRDNSADYRVSGLQVPKGCWDARVLKVIEPHDDEIVIPKTSCNVFVSTNIDFVLRCLGVKHLIVSGGLTDQCVESCVRTCCDLGYACTLVEDCCITHSGERHERALETMRGFCRIRTMEQVLEELSNQ